MLLLFLCRFFFLFLLIASATVEEHRGEYYQHKRIPSIRAQSSEAGRKTPKTTVQERGRRWWLRDVLSHLFECIPTYRTSSKIHMPSPESTDQAPEPATRTEEGRRLRALQISTCIPIRNCFFNLDIRICTRHFSVHQWRTSSPIILITVVPKSYPKYRHQGASMGRRG